MATVDDRVVQLEFDNKQFQSATAATMQTLEKLKQSLDFTTSKKGVEDLSGSMNRFSMGNIGTTIEGINGKLLAMGTIGVTALASITSMAVSAGLQIAKSLSIDQVVQGFKNYETQINAIQTIMANTGLQGSKGLGIVEKTLSDLNEYANLTIYDFSSLAENIGRFTAAGVAIQPATDAIKGMSNVAALTGANTQQLGSAMYQMSQALSTGVIRLMDWNSLSNANMGTQNFQEVLKATAMTLKDHGKAMQDAIKKQGNFRDSLTEGWLTTEIFTKSMGIMAGTMDKATGKYRAFTIAELKAKGYTEAQAKSLQKLSQAAIDSAVNIRTFSQMIEALREGVATAWSAVFKTLFGNIFDATKLFTGMYNVLYDVLTKPIYQLNNLLTAFSKLGGMKVVLQAVKNAFAALDSVIAPIKAAFREIFPPTTAKDLYNLAVQVQNFFASLKIGPELSNGLKRTFAGFFAVLDIGKQIMKGVATFFGILFGAAKDNAGSFLTVTANIGDFLVHLDDMLKKGGFIQTFFTNLGNAVKIPIDYLGQLGAWLTDAFAGKDAVITATSDAIGRIGDRLSPFGGLLSTLLSAWDAFIGVLNNVAPVFANFLNNVRTTFAQIPIMIQESVQNGDYSAILDTINTAIFGGIALLFRKFLKQGPQLSGGIIDSITSVFNQLTDTLKAMQTQLKAKALMEIAIAVGILTASVVALSLIPSGKLTKALAGLGATFGELLLAMKILDKISASAGFIKLPLIAGSLILLSTAILILTGAVLALSSMSWEDMSKGLLSLSFILGAVDVATKPLAARSPMLVLTAGALILLAGALVIIAGAIKILGSMSWESIGKGLAAITGALGGISLAMNFMPGPLMAITAAGVVQVAVALSILAGAMAIFAGMSWEGIGKGLVGIAGSLLIIAGAMALMPGPMLVVTAAGLAIVALALNGIAGAMKIMGSMTWEELAKSLVALAGSLIVLAGGLYLMTGAVGGAAALIVAAGALAILAPVLKVMGEMSWEEIARGLVAMAGAFAIIGLAGLLLTPVIPSILGLSGAIALLGIGIGLIGAGVLAFATGMTMLIAVGSLGVAALTAILQTVIGVIPTVMKALELALVAFAEAIIAAAPKMIEAFSVVVAGLLDMIIKLTPKIVQTLSVLLDALIMLAVKYTPKLTDAGMKIITGFLAGVRKNLPKLMDVAGDVIVEFIKGLGKQSLKIITAAGETLITFMAGITKWIDANGQLIQDTTADLGRAIVQGIIKGMLGMISGPIEGIGQVVSGIITKAQELLESHSPSKVFIRLGQGINQGLVIGILKNRPDTIAAVNSLLDVIKQAKDDASQTISDLKSKLGELEKKPATKANQAAIAAAKRDLAEAQAARAKLDLAYKTVAKEHQAQIKTLENLAAQYDVVKTKLENAQKALDDAKKQRDDFAASIKDQYSVLPTLDATTSLDQYFNAIRQATQDNLKFKATLEELRKLGLDDTSYRKFLQAGVAAQPFLDALLAAGSGAVQELDNIDATLASSAGDLGTSAGKALYQAGVDAAQGLVDGISKQMSVITSQMKTIGKAIADELKKELGIKSPSKVFAEIGAQTMRGLAQGMEQNNNVVDMSARRAGQLAIESLKNSMKGLSDETLTEFDMQPVIAPVLDLNQFRKDAVQMDAIFKQKPLEASVSAQNAAAAVSTLEALKAAQEASTALQTPTTTVTLEQNNYSPKALSQVEIYRQTKNQLSILKGALQG